MPVLFYSFGKLVGGTTPGGGVAIPDEALYGPGFYDVGILPIGDTTITFTKDTKSVQVINRDDTDPFSVSFDGGVTFINLGAYGQVRENVSVSSIILRAAVAGVDYAVIAVLRA